MHIYMRVTGRMWRICHKTCNHASICFLSYQQRTCRVLHKHIFEELQKKQRNKILTSLIAIDYSLSRTKTAEHTLHHGTPFAADAIQKIANARRNRHQHFMVPSARAQLNTKKKSYINIGHTTLVFMLCFHCRWPIFKSSKRNNKLKPNILIRALKLQNSQHHATLFANGRIQQLQLARSHVTEFHRTEKKPTWHFFSKQTKKNHISDKKRKPLKTHTTFCARKWNTIDETNKNKFETHDTKQRHIVPYISPFTCDGSWDKCTFTSECPVATDAHATTHAITS